MSGPTRRQFLRTLFLAPVAAKLAPATEFYDFTVRARARRISSTEPFTMLLKPIQQPLYDSEFMAVQSMEWSINSKLLKQLCEQQAKKGIS